MFITSKKYYEMLNLQTQVIAQLTEQMLELMQESCVHHDIIEQFADKLGATVTIDAKNEVVLVPQETTKKKGKK